MDERTRQLLEDDAQKIADAIRLSQASGKSDAEIETYLRKYLSDYAEPALVFKHGPVRGAELLAELEARIQARLDDTASRMTGVGTA